MSVQQPQQNDAQFDDKLLLSVEDWINCATAYRVGDGEREYWTVQIPDKLRDWAKGESAEEVDKRDARDADESEDHAEQGKRAEIATATACEQAGVEWEWMHDGYKRGDLRINGLRVDCKSRVENERNYMDLLVGCRDTGTVDDIQADIYVQVLISEDGTDALVSGFAMNFEVIDAGWFKHAQTHPTKLVPHDDLRDIGDII